jgi:hypothetical protein
MKKKRTKSEKETRDCDIQILGWMQRDILKIRDAIQFAEYGYNRYIKRLGEKTLEQLPASKNIFYNLIASCYVEYDRLCDVQKRLIKKVDDEKK